MKSIHLCAGKNISSFICASVFQKIDAQRRIFISGNKNLSNHFILLNPVSYTVLKDFSKNLDSFLSANAIPIPKHCIINYKGPIEQINFKNTYIVNYKLLLEMLFKSLSENQNVEFNPPKIPKTSPNTIAVNQINNDAKKMVFGNRHLIHIEVKRKNKKNNQSFFEITNDSWFYFAPCSQECAILQMAIPSFSDNPFKTLIKYVSKTKIIASLYESYVESSLKLIPAAPFIRVPNQPDSMPYLTGSSLLKFDPVSGYGLLNIMRSAILFAATYQQIENKSYSTKNLFHHYINRNLTGMYDHVVSCINLYLQLNNSIWSNEIQQMKKSLLELEQIRSLYQSATPFHLEGFTLKQKVYPIS